MDRSVLLFDRACADWEEEAAHLVLSRPTWGEWIEIERVRDKNPPAQAVYCGLGGGEERSEK